MTLPSTLVSNWPILAVVALLAVAIAGLLAWDRWRRRRLDLPPLEQLRDATRHLHRRGALRAHVARSSEDASRLMLQKLGDAP